MKHLIAAAMISSMALAAGTANAGGPVIVEDTVETVAEAPGSSMGILPIIIVGVVLCVALCSNNDDPRYE